MAGKSLLMMLLFFGLIVIHKSSQQELDGISQQVLDGISQQVVDEISGENLYFQKINDPDDNSLFSEYVNILCEYT
jgi:hypothetical protein